MLYFLFGKETYRLQKKLQEIEERFCLVNKTGLNIEKAEGESLNFQNFWDRIEQRSLFIKKKLFFVENFFSNADFKAGLERHLKEIVQSSDILVLIEKNELKKTDKFFLLLKKYAKCQEFDFLTGLKLKNWLKKEIGSLGLDIDEPGLKMLIDFVGSDLWQMSNEIKKLAAFKKESKKILAGDVALLVKPETEEVRVFNTIDCIAQRNKAKALKLISEHLIQGDDVFYLLSMITFQFRNLLMVKSEISNSQENPYFLSQKIVKKFGMHPFVAKKSLELSKRFSLEDIKRIYQRIFEADLAIKTGKIMPENGIKLLVADI